MKFVNIQSRAIYNPAMGCQVNPGATTRDLYKDLEKCLKRVVDICKNNFRIVLNSTETQLMANLMDLDDAGTKFDPTVIPSEIRNDPTGIKRLMEAERQRQHAELKATAQANKDAAQHEAIINGEIDEDRHQIKPLGVNRAGNEAKDAPLSGFDQILAENARIAAGQSTSMAEIANPVHAHAKKSEPEAAATAEAGDEPVAPVKKIRGKAKGKGKVESKNA